MPVAGGILCSKSIVLDEEAVVVTVTDDSDNLVDGTVLDHAGIPMGNALLID